MIEEFMGPNKKVSNLGTICARDGNNITVNDQPVAPSSSSATIISNIEDFCSDSNPIEVSCQLLGDVCFSSSRETNHTNNMRGCGAVFLGYHYTRATCRLHCLDTAAAVISLYIRTELLISLNIFSYQGTLKITE